MTVLRRIFESIKTKPDQTELEIARSLFGPEAVQQRVNGYIRQLVGMGAIRRDWSSSPYRYQTVEGFQFPTIQAARLSTTGEQVAALSEDEIKVVLRDWLVAQGYDVRVAMGKIRGIDIDARRGSERWIIEVKGPGAHYRARRNYFFMILGDLLQRMDDPNARYSIALPDLLQFRGLWSRVPELAKRRTGVTAILIASTEEISHLE